jgi:hypothetical protein
MQRQFRSVKPWNRVLLTPFGGSRTEQGVDLLSRFRGELDL